MLSTMDLVASRSGVARWLVPIGALAALLPWVSPVVALLGGIAVALSVDNPWPSRTRALAQRTLAWSVIGLGAGMNLAVVGRVGIQGLGYTAIGIGSALLLGTLLGRRLGVSRDSSLLVTVGTAICGGSAIAAVAPAIRAKEDDVSIALVTVFVLNAVALVVFPFVGHRFHLGQDAFGLWCALAIHDTSSVVGAASQYGERALEVATAAKLARALWIVPVSFGVAMLRARTVADPASGARPSPKRPWFIAGFLASAALVTFVPALAPAGRMVAFAAHRLLAATLFLVGLGLTRPALRRLGVRPLLQGVALWLTLATATLAAIVMGLVPT
ncbi:Putative membrane protein YeiH [Labilithrix luteola]|uniref:Putative membrane protein YeiH n=1 Tax=Labilithrix luteola TaxID=1391654 RepID=A0A0K1QCC2_9BACT|nr:putative sulfate exporter family transporter [Labilithrix luteola]AKV03302.1 Putative membrane protein YeiH [Labilithrix luteola]